MIPAERPHLGVAALTHAGERREHNEDRYAISSYKLDTDGTPVDLIIVADGIGGHQAGEVAAQQTVDAITQVVAVSSLDRPVETLRQALVQASEAVYREAQASPEREGMGSTVAVALIIGSRLYTASAGDSRIYLFRRGQLNQISVDHTWVQEALEREIITASQAQGHPHAHVLRRYVGGPRGVEPDFRLRLSLRESDSRSTSNQGHRLEAGDQLLLSTDGLTDLVTDDEIRAALNEQRPSDAAAGLMELARARGGHDNITLVLLTMPGVPRRRATGWLPWAAAVAILAGIVIGAALLAAGWLGWLPWSWLQPTPVATAPPAVSPAATSAPAGQGPSTAAPTETAWPIPSPTPTAAPSATPMPLPTVATPGG